MNWTKLYKKIKIYLLPYLAHAFLGVAVAGLSIMMLHTVSEYLTYIASLLIALVVAIAIEKADQLSGGVFNRGDIVATMIGNVMMLGLYQYVS